jgi:phosphatidylglycerophosphatase A
VRSRSPKGASAISADRKGELTRRDLRDPFVLLATVGGCGLAPVAPGTVGSLAALPVWWFWLAELPLLQQMAITVVAALLSIWIVARACRAAAVGDAPQIVLDEVVGQWLALIAAPKTLWALLLGFVLFRFFDIVKPPPVRWVDRHLGGGFGVVADDLLAGVLAACVLQLSVGWIAWPS